MASSLKDGLVGMLKEKHSGQRKQQQQSLRGRKKYSKLKEKLKRQSGLCSESWPGLGGGWGGFKHNAYSPSLPDPEVQGQGVGRAGPLWRLEWRQGVCLGPSPGFWWIWQAWRSLIWRPAAQGSASMVTGPSFLCVCPILSSVRTPPALHARMISSREP